MMISRKKYECDMRNILAETFEGHEIWLNHPIMVKLSKAQIKALIKRDDSVFVEVVEHELENHTKIFYINLM